MSGIINKFNCFFHRTSLFGAGKASPLFRLSFLLIIIATSFNSYGKTKIKRYKKTTIYKYRKTEKSRRSRNRSTKIFIGPLFTSTNSDFSVKEVNESTLIESKSVTGIGFNLHAIKGNWAVSMGADNKENLFFGLSRRIK